MLPVWENFCLHFITKESEGQRGEALAWGHTARMWQRWAWVMQKSACNAGDPGSISGVGGRPWRKKWQPTPVILAWEIP